MTLTRRSFLAQTGTLAAAAMGAPVAGAAHGLSRRLPRRHGDPRWLRGLRAAAGGAVFTAQDSGYAAAAEVYNERFDAVRPLAVARVDDAGGVQGAVRWALDRGVALRARSGGHSYAGYSTLNGGLVLDLRNLSQVRVDRATATATVGAGTQLIDLYAGLAAAGATVPAGSCPSVGVAGLTLGGGMGLAARAYGLTADHLTGVRIVTADGRLRRVDARRHPDLLWALRGGGGGNFGIVTELSFRVRPLPAAATSFFVSWPWQSAAEALSAWSRWAPRADPRITSILRLGVAGGWLGASACGQFLGPPSALSGLIAPILDIPGATLAADSASYLNLQLLWAGCAHTAQSACHTRGGAPDATLSRVSFFAKSDYLHRPICERGARALVDAVAARGAAPGSGAVLLDSYGGAISRVAPDATAFAHRDQLCAIQYLSYGGDRAWLQRTWQTMRRHVSGQAYQNYIDADLEGWQQAYYAGNYRRLLATRREYDPHHLFDFPQAIGHGHPA